MTLPIRRTAALAVCITLATLNLGGRNIISIVAAAENTELLIRRGVELRRQGKDAEAADFFRQAYVNSHTARAAAQLGLCEQALGQWVEAEQHLSEALLAESDPWIVNKRATLESSRKELRAKLASLKVQGGPPGSLIIVNDRMVGQLPLQDDVWMMPGKIVAVARKEGFQEQRHELQVAPGESAALEFSLKPPQPSDVSAPLSSEVTALGTPNQTSAGDEGPSLRTYATWGALGLGALSLGFGVFSHLGRESAISDFNNPSNNCYKTEGEVTGGPACNDLDASISSRTTATIVGYTASAVLLGVGTALFLTRPKAARRLACGLDFPLRFGVGQQSLLACNGTF